MQDNNDLATLVIRHHVSPSAKNDYESWLARAGRECRLFKGHLAASIIRPSGDSPYTIVVRFDANHALSRWIGSDIRQQLVAEAQPYLLAPEHLELRAEPAYWFTPPGAKPPPRRSKQFLVTLGAIFPMIVVVPLALQPLVAGVPLLAHPLVIKFMTAAIVVQLMVYVVMPRVMRRLSNWLSR